MNAIYCRVSTDEQAQKGYSLGDQLQCCRTRLLSMGLTYIKEYIDDGYSGEFIERPGLDQLRDDLRAKLIKNIIVYDPDRLSRNLTNQLIIADEIEKVGAKLIFITGDYDASPEGRLFFSIRGAISAFEKAKIRERTCRGKRAKATTGRIIQNSKAYGFGWDAENSLYTIDQEEAKVVKLIYSLCVDTKLGMYRITQEINKRGFRNKDNKPFSPSHINVILTKPMYYGEYHQFYLSTKQTGQKTTKTKKNPEENHVIIQIPSIISKETWDAVQDQLQQNKSLSKRNTKYDYLLRGLLYCPLCGRRLTGSVSHGRRLRSEDVVYYYYFCIAERNAAYKVQRCGSRRIPAKELDAALWDVLKNIAEGRHDISDYLKPSNSFDYTNEIEQLNKQIDDLEKTKLGITQWYKEGLIKQEEGTKQLQSINKEISVIVNTLNALTTVHKKNKPAEISATDILQAKTFEQKRNVLLDFGYKIFALKNNDDVLQLWFE